MAACGWPRAVRDIVLWADGRILVRTGSFIKTDLIAYVENRSNGGGVSGGLPRWRRRSPARSTSTAASGSLRAASPVVLRRRRDAPAMQTMTASTWVASGSVGDDGGDDSELRGGGGVRWSTATAFW